MTCQQRADGGASLCVQGKPSLWTSILEAEDNADDVERFEDAPDSPTHASGADLPSPAEAQPSGKDPLLADASDDDSKEAATAAGGSDEEEDGEGDMGPSTSGQGQMDSSEGHLQPTGPALGVYDMRKR